jgi:predicted Zn-dependent protease
VGRATATRTERAFSRIFAWLLGGALVLGLLAWGGYHVYETWQERRLVRRAAAYLGGGDVKQASLSARRAFQMNPESAGAARMLAEIGEAAADGSELEWRQRVVALAPQSVDDAMALVRTALRSNELPTAEHALQSIAPHAAHVPEYHAALGRVAEMRNRPADAEQHWQRAVELAPEQKSFQVQLAMLQLTAPDAAKRQAAIETLERFRTDESQRVAATRALIIDGGRRGDDPKRLHDLARDLQSYPGAAFNDRLLYLEVLRQLRDPAFDSYRAQLENEAAQNATHAAALISWMSANLSAADAVAFARRIPQQAHTTWPIPLTMAEAYARAEDWDGLRSRLEAENWGGFEFLRHAYLTRAARARDQKVAAEQDWWRAQKLAANHPQALVVLTRTVASWGWENETIDLLWNLTKSPEVRRDALQQLYQFYASRSDTAGLYRVLLRGVEAAPDDLMVQNNFAHVALLLNLETERARRIAADVARKEPANAAYTSTYAFALFTEGDIPGARETMETLPKEQLQSGSLAAYYGIILAAAGEGEKARPFLEAGAKAFLLPEERALLAKAQAATQ